jgi:hypothetical protein
MVKTRNPRLFLFFKYFFKNGLLLNIINILYLDLIRGSVSPNLILDPNYGQNETSTHNTPYMMDGYTTMVSYSRMSTYQATH